MIYQLSFLKTVTQRSSVGTQEYVRMICVEMGFARRVGGSTMVARCRVPFLRLAANRRFLIPTSSLAVVDELLPATAVGGQALK
jgi:hypothetical protein